MDAIASIPDGCGQVLLDSLCDLVPVLMGKTVNDLSQERMIKIWTIVYLSSVMHGVLKWRSNSVRVTCR